jgi:hypothetical protein
MQGCRRLAARSHEAGSDPVYFFGGRIFIYMCIGLRAYKVARRL